MDISGNYTDDKPIHNNIGLGARVIRRFTGSMTEGRLVMFSYMDLLIKLGIMHPSMEENPYWTSLFPDWQTEPICMILLPKPEKAVTKDDMSKYAELMGQQYSPEEFDKQYNKQPDTNVVLTPLRDLIRADKALEIV